MSNLVATISALIFITMLAGCQRSDAIENMEIPLNSATTPTARPDGWWQRRNNSFNRIAAGGNVELVFLGDSITQNWDGPGRKVWREYYSHRKAANFGIVSDRTGHVLYRVEHGNFAGISPKVIVLMVGTNNTTGPKQTAEGVMAIVKALREKAPKSKILLLAIFPRGKDAADTNRRDNAIASEMFSKVADGKTIYYMDIGKVLLNADGTISKDVMGDYIHLSPKGYRLWAEAIEPELAKLLDEK